MAESDNSRLALSRDRDSDRSAMAGADEQRAIAEVQGQILMARKFPRDLEIARDNILTECRRLGLAEDALYAYPRGDETIEGPSIRLAEVLARHWGNMSSGIQELQQHQGASDVEAFCWDLQTNNRWSVKFVVPHFRDTKNGKKPLRDSRDIYEMVANLGSRRLRACILRAIPGDIVDEAVAECKKTILSNSGPLTERVAKAVERFATIGVPAESLEKLLGHKLEACKEPEVRRLGNAYNAIKDGFASKESIFPDLLPAGALSDEEAAAQAAAGATSRGPAMPESKDDKPAGDQIDPNARIGEERDQAIQKAMAGMTEEQVNAICGEFKVDETFELKNSQFKDFLARCLHIHGERERAAADAKQSEDKPAAETKAPEPKQEAPKQPELPQQQPAAAATGALSEAEGEKTINQAQQKKLFEVGAEHKVNLKAVKVIIKEIAGVDTSAAVKQKFFQPILDKIAGK